MHREKSKYVSILNLEYYYLLYLFERQWRIQNTSSLSPSTVGAMRLNLVRMETL